MTVRLFFHFWTLALAFPAGSCLAEGPTPVVAEGPVVSADTPEKYYYLLAEPMQSEIGLTKYSVMFHVGQITLYEAIKVAAYVEVMGPWASLLLYITTDLPFFPQSFVTRPVTELEVRALVERIRMMKGLAKIPALNRVGILSSKKTQWWGISPVSREFSRFVAFSTARPLGDVNELVKEGKWEASWGNVVPISDIRTPDSSFRSREPKTPRSPGGRFPSRI